MLGISRFCSRVHDPFKTSHSSRDLTVELSKPSDVFLKQRSIIDRVESCGFVIFKQTYETSKSTFRSVCEEFGPIQNRVTSNYGISSVVDTHSKSDTHAVSSNIKFFPHTDGAYLDDVIIDQKEFKIIQPPKFVILECVTPALHGGENFLVDGKTMLSEVMHASPELLPSLYEKSISFLRRNVIGDRVSVYDKDAQGRHSIRYSYDQEMLIPKNRFDSIKMFNEKYVLNPNNHYVTKLSTGDILVMDNRRVLHGRTEFYGTRVLRRAWIANTSDSRCLIPAKTPDGSFYPSSSYCFRRNFSGDHLPLPRSLKTEPIPISTGFTLPLSITQREK